MAELTTWRCGGAAQRVYTPGSIVELCAYLARLPEAEPLTWLGRGSNVLVRDGGLRGVVVHIDETLGALELDRRCARARAQAGAPCARLARETAQAGFAGLEFLAGIPGSVGGALAMNAGAAGCEIWERVESIDTVDRAGARHTLARADVRTGYRSAQLPAGHGVLGGAFRLDRAADPAAPMRRLRAQMQRRRATQPVAQPSCGSVFRNPEAAPAAALIERCGLKGHRIGGAEVSRLHANFIVTEPGARARDVEALIEHVRAAVAAGCGVRLELEARILGDAA